MCRKLSYDETAPPRPACPNGLAHSGLPLPPFLFTGGPQELPLNAASVEVCPGTESRGEMMNGVDTLQDQCVRLGELRQIEAIPNKSDWDR